MDFEAIKEAIAKRDYLDSHREVSPLIRQKMLNWSIRLECRLNR